MLKLNFVFTGLPCPYPVLESSYCTVLLPEACFDDWDSDKKHDYSLKCLYWFFKYFLSLGLRLGLLTISLIGGSSP